MSHAQLRSMARHYKTHPANLHELAKRIEDWTNCEGGVDRDGLYRFSTCNPDGRWDWYEIGGRWDGYIPHSRENASQIESIAGQGGHAACFRCACKIADFAVRQGLSYDECLAIFSQWNEVCALPNWSPGELNHKLTDAFQRKET